MRLIERDRLALSPPDPGALDRVRDRLRRLHGLAYGWDPPALDVGERATSTSMRQYVRRWINEWDLKRLYPDYTASTMVADLAVDYHEEPDLEVASEGDGS